MQKIKSAQFFIFWWLICPWLLLSNCTAHLSARKRIDPATILLNQQSDALISFENRIELFPGQASMLRFPYFGPFKEESLVCDGKKIPFFRLRNEKEAFAFISRSYFSDTEKFSCDFTFGERANKRTHEIKGLYLTPFRYPEERLTVDEKKINPSLQDQQRIEKENQMLTEIFSKSSGDVLFDSPFIAPLNSKITSGFGTRRLFNQLKKMPHLGVDFRARAGTPIKAANSGRVVFLGDLFYSGNSVIIDHGVGVFTMYAHLSKILIKMGDEVTKETTIGLSGKSGRVSGPHLHWGVKIHGDFVDGFSLISATQKL